MTELQCWPLSERPREKLLTKGPQSLSDAEVLAVLFGNSAGGQGALMLANTLIDRFGSLRNIIHGTQAQLCDMPGLGENRYAQITVVWEIAKRVLESPLKRQPVFQQVSEVKTFLLTTLRHEKKEHFGLLCLNSQHHLIAFRLLFSGTINAAAVYPREIVRQVIDDNAAAVILVHNHPSGVPEPSDADIRLTKDVSQALALIDVSVLDHFIVGDAGVVSLAQKGLM
ncbi:DNA repair protein RadC [Alteromonas sp. C1M14]|uniref:RadC family protein n=1 Tax=Alteromonas sp. C1M14 TaxID=2841567 RepID=UPI001C08F488|nr:DNA repair protein RadC [Alteromonas sp. C1M14]MBU2979833.1 DNA repair protein RadC [Alteromonas sp. C1M14]